MGIFDALKDIFAVPAFARTTVSQQAETKIKLDWENIRSLVASKSPSQLRQALLTADKSLDTALKDVFAGETMAERLKAAKDRFDRDVYTKIWQAHKVRNNLVHESGYEPPYYVLTQSVESLRAGLQTLGVRV